MPIIPVLKRERPEDCEFKVSLDYIVRCLIKYSSPGFECCGGLCLRAGLWMDRI